VLSNLGFRFRAIARWEIPNWTGAGTACRPTRSGGQWPLPFCEPPSSVGSPSDPSASSCMLRLLRLRCPP